VFRKNIFVYSIIKELYKGFCVVLGLLTFTISAKENTKEKEKKRDVFIVVFFKTKARLIAYI